MSESAGLAAVLSRLLHPTGRLSRFGSFQELAESGALDTADAVVLDMPSEGRAAAVGQLRHRFLGPLVVLVARGDDRRALRDGGCRMLTRPFSAEELAAALAVPISGRPSATLATAAAAAAATVSATTAASGVDPVDRKAAARQAPIRSATTAVAPGGNDVVGRAQRLLASITQGWRAQRRVRLAGFSVFALIAFTAAFALAAQGRCGPGCDVFGTRFSPSPTVQPAESRAPSTSRPKQAVASTAGPAGSAATGAYRGAVNPNVATTDTTMRRTTTTTRKPSPVGGSGTVTTRRPTTTAPPTTTPTTLPTTTVTVPEPPTT